jgi:regulatory protein
MISAFDCALRLLSQRDHGQQELIDKLIRKGYGVEDSQQASRYCQEQGLQSDERFVDMIVRARIRQGYGPLRINQELRNKHINADIINQYVNEHDEQWDNHITFVWQKKFKTSSTSNSMNLQKQQRFLLYRGFSAQMIARLFKHKPTLGSFEQDYLGDDGNY